MFTHPSNAVQLLQIITAMRDGLKKVPGSTKSWNADRTDPESRELVACCPLAHAAVGLGHSPHTYFALEGRWPVLLEVKVKAPPEVRPDRPDVTPDEHGHITLRDAIETLSGRYRWTTERVIRWLLERFDVLDGERGGTK